jgi:hypothetical protein
MKDWWDNNDTVVSSPSEKKEWWDNGDPVVPTSPQLSNPAQAAAVQQSQTGQTMDAFSQGWAPPDEGWGSQMVGMTPDDAKWMNDKGLNVGGALTKAFREINQTLLYAGAQEYNLREIQHTQPDLGWHMFGEPIVGAVGQVGEAFKRGQAGEPLVPSEELVPGAMGVALMTELGGRGPSPFKIPKGLELVPKETPLELKPFPEMAKGSFPPSDAPLDIEAERARAFANGEAVEPKPPPIEVPEVAKPPSERPEPTRPPMTPQELRNLGIIGPEHEEPAMTDSPSASAEKAVPHSLSSDVTQASQDKILGHQPGEYDARGKEWVDKIDEPEDVRRAVEQIAAANDYFPEARGGEVSPATRNAVAEAAGMEPGEIDEEYFSTHFDNDGKVRAVIQVLRQTAQDYAKAAQTARVDPTVENVAAAEEARIRATHVIEYTMGKRAESGRSLATWKELYREVEVTKAKTELTTQEQTGAAPAGTSEIVDAAHETGKALKEASTAAPGEEKPVGLQRLVNAAQDLVDNAAKPPPEPTPGAPRPQRSFEVNSLVDAARDVLKKFGAHDPEFSAFRDELEKLSRGEGKLDTTVEAARDLLKKAEKPKPEGEIGVEAEPKVKSVKSQLKAAAKRLVDAAEGAKAKAKAGVSEIADLLETTRQAVGRLRGQQVSSEMSAFTEALRGKDPQAAAEAARALIEAEGKEKSPVAARAPTDYDAVMGAARKVAKSAEERAAAAEKPELMPDIKQAVQGASDAAKELQAQRKSVLGQLVKQAEDQAVNMTKQKLTKEPTEALPLELQALVDKTKRVVDRFGGTTRAEKAAFLVARTAASLQQAEENIRMAANLTPNQMAKLINKLRISGLAERPHWAFWLWQQGLISGLLTHTKYLAVNAGTLFLERTIAPVAAAVVGKIKGEQTSILAPLYGNIALVKSVPHAIEGAMQAFKTGMRVPLESELRLFERGEESPQAMGAQTPFDTKIGPNWGMWKNVFNETQLEKAAHVLGTPGKSANFIHTFFKILSQKASGATIAFEKATLEGHSVLEGNDFWQRYEHHLANPTDEALVKQTNDAYSGAFMSKLGPTGQAFANFTQKFPAAKLFFPFTHIPANIVGMSVKYSPLAILDSATRDAILGRSGSAAQNLAIAKMTVGSAVMTYYMHKALSGEATGDYPHDVEEKRRWQMLGIQPNSIKIAGHWISMERFGPAGNVAMIGANLGQTVRNYQAAKKRGDDDALTAAMWSGALGTANILGNETGLQTLHNMMKAMEDPAEGSKFLIWEAGSVLPFSSMASQTASAMDPYMRQTKTLLDGLKYRIPWLRETLPAKLDNAFGEPVPNPGYHSIFRNTFVNSDPTKAEMDRAHYYPAAPEKTIKGVRLSSDQYDEFQERAGIAARGYTDVLTHQPTWQSKSLADRHQAFQKAFEAARRGAEGMMLMQHHDLLNEAYQQRLDYINGTSPTLRPKTPPPVTRPIVPTAAPQAPIKPGEPFRPGLPGPAAAPQLQTLPPPVTPPSGAEATPEALGIRG